MLPALISVAQARARLAAGEGRLLVVGEAVPAGSLPSAASLVEARAFRSGAARGVAGLPALKRLCVRCGIGAETPVLLADAAAAGPHAALAFWTLTLYGLERLTLVDGGGLLRDAREAPPAQDGGTPGSEESPLSPRPDGRFRALRGDVRRHLDAGRAVLDVRSPAEFSGTLTAPADAPQEGILRGGHLPGAVHVPWNRALRPDGCLHPRSELKVTYVRDGGLDPAAPLVVYSRTAARASHTWFVLTQLLDFEAVRVYDGGWAEWGNLVAVPVERGT